MALGHYRVGTEAEGWRDLVGDTEPGGGGKLRLEWPEFLKMEGSLTRNDPKAIYLTGQDGRAVPQTELRTASGSLPQTQALGLTRARYREVSEEAAAEHASVPWRLTKWPLKQLGPRGVGWLL